jgi:hypothetical protein
MMPTKSPAKTKKAVPTAVVKPASTEATIDFPQEGEQVFPGHYAIRITAKPGVEVEINVGGQDWFGCRESIGHYWYDWWVTRPGKVDLSLRVKSGGKWKTVARRTTTVTQGSSN